MEHFSSILVHVVPTGAPFVSNKPKQRNACSEARVSVRKQKNRNLETFKSFEPVASSDITYSSRHVSDRHGHSSVNLLYEYKLLY